MKCIIGRILIILGTLGSAYMFYYMMNDTISNYVSPFSKREVVIVLSFITFLVLFFAGLFITLSYAAQKDEKPTYNVRIKDRETIKIDNTFLTENPSILKLPKLHNAIDNSKLVPNTSSIENAIFSL